MRRCEVDARPEADEVILTERVEVNCLGLGDPGVEHLGHAIGHAAGNAQLMLL